MSPPAIVKKHAANARIRCTNLFKSNFGFGHSLLPPRTESVVFAVVMKQLRNKLETREQPLRHPRFESPISSRSPD